MFSPTLTTEVTSAPLYQVSVVWVGVGELFEKPMPSRWFNPNWCYGVLLVAAVVGFYMLLSHWPPLPCKFVGSFGSCGWLATMGQGSFFNIIFSMRSFTNCSNWTSTKGYCASWSMQWSQPFCAVQNSCWTSQPWLLDLRLSNWFIISFLTTFEMYVVMPVMLHVQCVFCDHSTAYTQCYRLECSRWRGDGTNSLYCEWQDSDS